MKNNKRSTPKTRAVRAAIAAGLALLFAGCAMTVAASALAAPVPALSLYAAALVAVALCAVGAVSGAGALAAGIAFAATAALYAAANAQGLRALRAVFDAWGGGQGDPDAVALGTRTLLTCGAFTCGAFFFALLNTAELSSLAITVLLSILVSCHAMSETASLPATVPGLVAAAAAFALTGGLQRDLSAWRALIPAALAVALALMLIPGGGTTWKPLEDAANRVRAMFEQYFRFTHERIAFSISEEGYDHAGEVGDAVISMLGGPADPRPDPVMEVRTDAETLLRGAIRTAYTGYSWVDAAPKNRYLYYDLTHRAIRDRVFSPPASLRDALLDVDVTVELLDAGTSTLFVPGLLERFEMDLSTAVYYNTAGEMFLTRDVQAGDRYALRALLPLHGDGLRQAVARGAEAEDEAYREVLSNHTALPEGIEGGVYTLTASVIQNAQSDYDRALAIMDYLRANMRYTLKPQVPPRGRDFVSHFLLDAKEGYCSYYATAMAVMGRIAGLPTRYVEGYLAKPGQTVLTGENAHAWAEVYFRGVGWIPFDATGGTTGSGAGQEPPPEGLSPENDSANDGDGGLTDAENDLDGLSDAPTPTPEPPSGAADEPTPSPEPQGDVPQDDPETVPEDLPEDAGQPADGSNPERRGGAWWVLLLLILLALLGFAAYWVVKRLRRSDPAILCAETRSAHRAALILYRANLTLLASLGQTPTGGETPLAFAQRVSAQLKNPDYAAFVAAVADAAYGRQPLRRSDVEVGRRAYDRFRAALGLRERARFTLTRIFRGLGDFEAIP